MIEFDLLIESFPEAETYWRPAERDASPSPSGGRLRITIERRLATIGDDAEALLEAEDI